MSENLLIKEGSLSRKISPVDRLRIRHQGSGSSLWRNVEELEVDELSVTENGVYIAMNDDLFAYDTVEVEVEEDDETGETGETITGTDPDTGDDYEVGRDENGNLTKEKIPSAIHIVVPPRKRKYVEGDLIDYSGIHVYLMDGNNHRFTSEQYPTGEIPFNELEFPVVYAEGGESGGDSYASDLDTGFDGAIPVYSSASRSTSRIYRSVYPSASASMAIIRSDEIYILAILASSTSGVVGSENRDGTILQLNSDSSFTYNGKTVYYKYFTDSAYNFQYQEYSPQVPDMGIGSDGTKIKNIAWTIVYGEIEIGENDIPVQWTRPQDYETLEDTFEIEIVAEGEDEPGEEEEDPYAGSYDFEYGGRGYNINQSIYPPLHFSNQGYVWQEGFVDQHVSISEALELNLIMYAGGSIGHQTGGF